MVNFGELSSDFGKTTLQCYTDTVSSTIQSVIAHCEPVIKHFSLFFFFLTQINRIKSE